tara:strand:+ start:290 stop:466 length:177 start_codon:yes stop_codon:yes gene_type:complete
MEKNSNWLSLKQNSNWLSLKQNSNDWLSLKQNIFLDYRVLAYEAEPKPQLGTVLNTWA